MPTVIATAAPSRIPRYGPSRSRNARAGDEDAEEDGQAAEARHGAQVHAPLLAGLVDDAEDARHAPDRRA